MNSTDFGSSVICPLNSSVIQNHGVKFGENWITFDPNPHIKSILEINVYASEDIIDCVLPYFTNRFTNIVF